MPDPTLAQAMAALETGNADKALDTAWKAVRPAVLRQDAEALAQMQDFAERVSREHADDDRVRGEAQKLSAYCAGCMSDPRDSILSVFSLKRLFSVGRSERKKCPDCAESIQPEARVCRFCGYRYPEPQ